MTESNLFEWHSPKLPACLLLVSTNSHYIHTIAAFSILSHEYKSGNPFNSFRGAQGWDGETTSLPIPLFIKGHEFGLSAGLISVSESNILGVYAVGLELPHTLFLFGPIKSTK